MKLHQLKNPKVNLFIYTSAQSQDGWLKRFSLSFSFSFLSSMGDTSLRPSTIYTNDMTHQELCIMNRKQCVRAFLAHTHTLVNNQLKLWLLKLFTLSIWIFNTIFAKSALNCTIRFQPWNWVETVLTWNMKTGECPSQHWRPLNSRQTAKFMKKKRQSTQREGLVSEGNLKTENILQLKTFFIIPMFTAWFRHPEVQIWGL